MLHSISAPTGADPGVQPFFASLPDAPNRRGGAVDVLCAARRQPSPSSRRTMSPIAHIWRTSSLATATLATLALLPAAVRSA